MKNVLLSNTNHGTKFSTVSLKQQTGPRKQMLNASIADIFKKKMASQPSLAPALNYHFSYSLPLIKII